MTAPAATTPIATAPTMSGPAVTPVPRVSGPDEAFLLAEEKLGYGTSIQYCWVLDDDPESVPSNGSPSSSVMDCSIAVWGLAGCRERNVGGCGHHLRHR